MFIPFLFSVFYFFHFILYPFNFIFILYILFFKIYLFIQTILIHDIHNEIHNLNTQLTKPRLSSHRVFFNFIEGDFFADFNSNFYFHFFYLLASHYLFEENRRFGQIQYFGVRSDSHD